ncbi:hypothetical protein AA3271_1363 [Gluconobacter japonicus NBRC 3271]|nr:hypothetical protein AA3271_1363 [Gluconobacter japonicus NBRC 3271]
MAQKGGGNFALIVRWCALNNSPVKFSNLPALKGRLCFEQRGFAACDQEAARRICVQSMGQPWTAARMRDQSCFNGILR